MDGVEEVEMITVSLSCCGRWWVQTQRLCFSRICPGSHT